MPTLDPVIHAGPLTEPQRHDDREHSQSYGTGSLEAVETAGSDNGKRSSTRLAAETFMPMMVEAFHDGLREAGSLSRWLLATLVAVNGAAGISMLPLKLEMGAKLAAAGAFLFGILAALAAAIWSLNAFKRVSTSAGTMLGYWLTVIDDGARLEALEATMKQHMDQAIGARASHFLVFVSVAAFLAGCAFVGWGMFARGDM